MSYIVVSRKPGIGDLLALMDIDEGYVIEYDSYQEAEEAADENAAFSAWGYEILLIGI